MGYKEKLLFLNYQIIRNSIKKIVALHLRKARSIEAVAAIWQYRRSYG